MGTNFRIRYKHDKEVTTTLHSPSSLHFCLFVFKTLSSTIFSAHVFLGMEAHTVLPKYSRVGDHRLGTIDLTRAVLYRKLILPLKPANVHSSSVRRSRAHETLSPHDRMLIGLTLCRSFSGKLQQL